MTTDKSKKFTQGGMTLTGRVQQGKPVDLRKALGLDFTTGENEGI